MSMVLLVIMALESSPDEKDLNSAAKSLNVPIEFMAKVNLKEQSGFLPVSLNGNETGYETYFGSFEEIKSHLSENSEINFKHPVVYHFKFGGHAQEVAAAFYTAYILAEKYGAVAFDTEGGSYLSATQLKQAASAFEKMPE